MGVLDDAIKEHLELKRLHGADPGEVDRLEHEALGPARREAAAPAGDDDAAGASEAYEPTDEDEHVEALVEDEEPIYEEDLLGEEAEEDPPLYEDPPLPDEDPPPPDAHPSPAPPADQPTVAFDVTAPEGPAGPGARSASEGGPAEGGDAHDELEETPEFLQETPEHDRLWFEQKPPKDFDF